MNKKKKYVILTILFVIELFFVYGVGRSFLFTHSVPVLDIIIQILLLLPVEGVLYMAGKEEKMPKKGRLFCKIFFWYALAYCVFQIVGTLIWVFELKK